MSGIKLSYRDRGESHLPEDEETKLRELAIEKMVMSRNYDKYMDSAQYLVFNDYDEQIDNMDATPEDTNEKVWTLAIRMFVKEELDGDISKLKTTETKRK